MSAGTPPSAPRPVQLLERGGDLELISTALDAADTGRGELLVFEGAAGVGKSSFLAAARRMARARGASTLQARGGELEADYPFGVVRQLFEPRLGAAEAGEAAELRAAAGAAASLLSPFGTRQRDERPPGRDAVLHDLYWLVRRLGESSPVLVLVDDLQWVDRPSLEFLLYLAQRLEELPVVLVATRTIGEPARHGDLSDRLEAAPLATVRPLVPLSAEAVRRVAEDHGFAVAGTALAEAVSEASGGNPFLLKALLESARVEGLDARSARAHGVRELGSESVSRAVALRLERLPEGARALAQAAAVLGDGASLSQAAALAQLGPLPALEAAEALVRADILASVEPLLAFRHSIVRVSIYGALPAAARAHAHLAAARVLADDRARSAHVAAHLLRSEPAEEPWALEALRARAREALRRESLQSGIAYLRRALAERPEGTTLVELLVELGEAEAAAGMSSGVTRLAEAAELAVPGPPRAEVLYRLGRALWTSGRAPEAVRAFERALGELAGQSSPLTTRVRAALAASGRLDRSLRDKASKLAGGILREPGFGRHREPALLALVAFENALAGRRSARVVDLGERALGGGALLEEHAMPSPEYYAACMALVWADELQTAEIALSMAVETARGRGSERAAEAALRLRAWAILQRGRLSQAAADATAASLGGRVGPPAAVPDSRTMLAEVHLERGDLEAAAALLEPAEDRRRRDDRTNDPFWLAAKGRLLFLRGEAHEALSALLDSGRAHEALGVENPAVLPWRSRAAIVAARTGDRARARALATEEVALARAFGAARPLGVALRAAALVGSPGTRLEPLREAVATLERSPAALDRARALIDLGAELRHVGKRRESRQALRAGLDLAHRCDATRLVNRAREELVASGARLRRMRLSGSESLTARERQVAELAAAGLGNREIAERLFVTPKTVEWHLGNAYRKLELHSRDALMRALHGEEPDDDSA